MIEYIILDEPHAIVQKKLNQWRHDYMLQIYVMVQSRTNQSNTYLAIGRLKNQEPIPPEYKL